MRSEPGQIRFPCVVQCTDLAEGSADFKGNSATHHLLRGTDVIPPLRGFVQRSFDPPHPGERHIRWFSLLQSWITYRGLRFPAIHTFILLDDPLFKSILIIHTANELTWRLCASLRPQYGLDSKDWQTGIDQPIFSICISSERCVASNQKTTIWNYFFPKQQRWKRRRNTAVEPVNSVDSARTNH